MGRMKELAKKGLLICLAACCIGAGVGIILFANIGGDTVTVFQDGLHSVLSCTYGQASRVYNAILIAAALVLARKYFGAGTILSALILGYVIDFSFDALTALFPGLPFPGRLVAFLLGQTVYTVGLALLIRCRLGMNCLDGLLYRLSDLTDISYKFLRIAADLLLTLVGWLLGGVVGIGTVISILSTGYMVDFFAGLGCPQVP